MTLESVFAELKVVKNLVDGAPVPVQHTHSANYCIDEGGTTWIRKRDITMGLEELLAEALGWLMGSQLGLPIPLCATHTDTDGTRSWLAEMVPNVVHWAPIHINNIQNPEGLGAMTALDALLLIPDRHERNILIQDTGRRTSRVWAIDHGQSLISQAGKSADVQGAINEPHALARGIPVDLVGPSAMRTAIRASKIRKSTLRSAVRAAGRFAGEKQTSAIENCVIFRCQQAEMLVAGYLETVRRRR